LKENEGALPEPHSGEPDGEGVREREAVRPEPSKKKRFPGSELLSGGSAREILHRIFEGDPFGLMDRIEERLRDRAILIDEARVYSSATARIAFVAKDYEGDPPIVEWLDHCIDGAIATLIQREAQEERRGIPPTEPFDPHWIAMSQILGIEPPLARRAIHVFHTLPLETRRAFYAVAVEGKGLHRWVAEGHGPPEKVEARLQYALIMMSTLGKYGLGGPDGADGSRGEFDDE